MFCRKEQIYSFEEQMHFFNTKAVVACREIKDGPTNVKPTVMHIKNKICK
jgi:hypothetical protein